MMPEVRLFHSRKRLNRYCKRKYGERPRQYDAEGQMYYRGGEALVLMTYVGREEAELSLLVHEAYHAAVAHMAFLGEDNAGEETMAYLIQSITHGLFMAHFRWKRKKGLVD